MCTAITYQSKDHYFGRNLDLEYSYQENITITPRNYLFHFRKMQKIESHYAMIGMAYIQDNYPLYYEATNEKGLSMAGLNFPENAYYYPYDEEKDNITPFELIPWLLSQCASIKETLDYLDRINLYAESFSDDLPLSPLHWIISDKQRSLTIESTKDGLKIYENPIGVLTNNPCFDYQLFNLNQYMHLSNADPNNTFLQNHDLSLKTYSKGMGAIGLPGDASSMSRFVKATFIKANSVCDDSEIGSVSQFFHILKSVEMPRGCILVDNHKYDITIYSSCCNCDKGIYYYTSYDCHQICAVHMHHENLDGDQLIYYPLIKENQFYYQN